MLTALRIINVVIWSGLFAYVLPGAWSAIRGNLVRRGDPMRLSIASVSIVMVLGNLRFLLAPGNESLLLSIAVLSASVGIYKIVLVHAYGRGPRL